MVSTRSHPSIFPQQASSPTKALPRSTRSTTADPSSPPPSSSPTQSDPRSVLEHRTSKPTTWKHTPSNLVLIWLLISLPLVFWDTGYVLMRPHTMPGGSLHSPIWTPYALYGTVDYIYGFPAWNARNGFTSAQGTLNVVESAGYILYLWIVWKYGREERSVEGRGAPSLKTVGWIGAARSVGGKEAGIAAFVGFTMAAMTVSKTVLYALNEVFSGFANVGHNDALSLIFLWIIPNGAWLVLPSYMVYVMGQEILEGLAIASGAQNDITPAMNRSAVKGE